MQVTSNLQINESLNQILNAKDAIGEMFYKHFLDNYPDVQKHFEGVNMRRQGVLLATALMVIERYYAHPTPAVAMYLRYLGTKHKDWSIGRDLYPVWVNAMIETMVKFHGDDWSPELERQWREAFSRAIDLMLEGYLEHFTV